MIREERIKQEAEKYRLYRESCGVIDPVVLDEIDDAYYDGYMCAKKTTVEKAIEHIKNHWDEILVYDFNQLGGCVFNMKKTLDNFRKAMEE